MPMEKIEYKSGGGSPLHKLSRYYTAPIDLEKGTRASGAYAWALVLGTVLVYDIYAIKTKKAETLTRFFWRQTENPIKGIVPIVIWSGLTAHLLLEKSIRKKAFG